MNTQDSPLKATSSIPDAAWEELARKRIYFGHQSVGYNILDGIREVMRRNPKIQLNIVETTEPAMFDEPILGHSRLGVNRDTDSKYDNFLQILKTGIGEKVDIAFFKLCYVDIDVESDTDKILKKEIETLATAARLYHKLKLFPFKVPITKAKVTWKVYLKQLFGNKRVLLNGNVKRNQFNSALKTAIAKWPIFDLAGAESMRPDGSVEKFWYEGNSYQSAYPPFLSDEGHLNAQGQVIIADQFLSFLVKNMSR